MARKVGGKRKDLEKKGKKSFNGKKGCRTGLSVNDTRHRQQQSKGRGKSGGILPGTNKVDYFGVKGESEGEVRTRLCLKNYLRTIRIPMGAIVYESPDKGWVPVVRRRKMKVGKGKMHIKDFFALGDPGLKHYIQRGRGGKKGGLVNPKGINLGTGKGYSQAKTEKTVLEMKDIDSGHNPNTGGEMIIMGVYRESQDVFAAY